MRRYLLNKTLLHLACRFVIIVDSIAQDHPVHHYGVHYSPTHILGDLAVAIREFRKLDLNPRTPEINIAFYAMIDPRSKRLQKGGRFKHHRPTGASQEKCSLHEYGTSLGGRQCALPDDHCDPSFLAFAPQMSARVWDGILAKHFQFRINLDFGMALLTTNTTDHNDQQTRSLKNENACTLRMHQGIISHRS